VATDLEYVHHICDQLRTVGGVAYRKMFGEYALYVDGKVVALVCDNQLFVKPTDAGEALLTDPRRGAPYPGARPHFIADEYLDDPQLLSQLISATASALPPPKVRSRGGRK
jgi:TfoX/Sxy family transcriptional regulator of competence genes